MDNLSQSKFLRFWFPAILYSGIIFCVSSVPNVKIPLQEVRFDKVLHVLEYMPFGFFLARGIYNTRIPAFTGMFWGVIISILFLHGVSDEFYQSFVPGRSAGGGDVIADVTGGVIGGYVYLLFLNQSNNKTI